MEKLQVGILGATGAAGLEFVRALSNHPWFEIGELYASPRNKGKTLEEASRLNLSRVPKRIRNMTLGSLQKVSLDLDLICSALPSKVAIGLEGQCAQHTPVISTTSAYRYESDVPMIISEVNADHYRLLEQQRKRGWKGWIAPGPNCTTVALVIAIAPIYQELGVRRIVMSSYQSISGGGANLIQKWRQDRKRNKPYPINNPKRIIQDPPLWLDANVIGYITNEEEKVKKETGKILGSYSSSRIKPASIRIATRCVRVPTYQGHFENILIETREHATVKDIVKLYREFNRHCRRQFGKLPSSPSETIITLNRSPQPYYDVNIEEGMATLVGRINQEDVFRNGLSFQVLSNNLEKGAAKGMVQVAEYLYAIGFLKSK